MKVTAHWSDLLTGVIYWVSLTLKGQRQTGRTPRDYRGSDWSNAATSQGNPRPTATIRARRRQGRLLPRVSEGTGPW